MSIRETTTMSLRMVFSVVLCVVAGTAAWADIRWQVKDLRREMDFLQLKIELQMSDRWTKVDDHIFMREYSARNELEMPIHRRVTE